MREILKALMLRDGDDAYSLEVKSGVPQPTTHRFLTGKHKSANEATVERWASAYEVTSSQLRGDIEIVGLKIEPTENKLELNQYSLATTKISRVSEPDPMNIRPKPPKNADLSGKYFTHIPLLNIYASMGEGFFVPEEETVMHFLRLSTSWINKTLHPISNIKNIAFIHGMGDSMIPTFNDSDILLVDTGISSVTVDGVYVLEAHQRLFIKRVRQRIDSTYEISSDNPTVKTVDILNGDHQVNVKGRVIWVWNGRRI